MVRTQHAPSAADRGSILARATFRAAGSLGLTQRDLSAVIGVSPASVSRLGRGRELDPDSKEGELAVLFLRLYRSLDTLVGGEEAKARAWMQGHNNHLGGIPAERIRTVAGIVDVVGYLDALRGKL